MYKVIFKFERKKIIIMFYECEKKMFITCNEGLYNISNIISEILVKQVKQIERISRTI